MTSKKGMNIETIPRMFSYVLLIVALVFLIMAMAKIVETTKEGTEATTESLIHMSVLNKVLTDEDCLSTGELGILNRTLLNSQSSECLKIYGVDCKLKVTSESGKEWKFEYELGEDQPHESSLNFVASAVKFVGSLFGDGGKGKYHVKQRIPVLIKDSTGTEPGSVLLKTDYEV